MGFPWLGFNRCEWKWQSKEMTRFPECIRGIWWGRVVLDAVLATSLCEVSPLRSAAVEKLTVESYFRNGTV